jgi:hypothetical protein
MPVRLVLVAVLMVGTSSARGAEPGPEDLVQKVVSAVGGEDRLLRLFRMRERLNVSSDPGKPGSERVSVLEPPRYWWVGNRERVREDHEPATFLVWAWTLGALTDPASKVELLPEIVEDDQPLVGLRVSGAINPPMDLYFGKSDHRLSRIDWRSDTHRFRDWKEHDGVKYPSRCVGSKKATGKPWYFTEILEVERLKTLPEGLKR